jgi:hypothetical protein
MSGMFGLVLTLVFVSIWIYVIMDIISTPADDVRFLPKLLWLLFVVLFALAAALLWLLMGRPRRVPADGGPDLRDEPYSATSGQSARDIGTPRPDGPDVLGRWVRARRGNAGRPPLAPDDDPEFLRELSDRIRRSRPDDPPHTT